MARTVSVIQETIELQMVANFETIGITIDRNAWSRRNLLRLLAFTFATIAAYLEQLMDNMIGEVETFASRTASATAQWIQYMFSIFQYSSTDPQVLQISEGRYSYPTTDATLRIVTACAVESKSPNYVTVKLAKNSPLEALTASELAACQGYINLIGTAGIVYSCISLSSAKIYINANIYYKGLYASTIETDVVAALEDFFLNLSTTNFNGSIKMSDIESAIRNVEGVNDVVLLNVKGRENSQLYAAGVDFIRNTATLQRIWNTQAGYVSEETTTGYTFADSLNFIAE